MRDRAVRVEAVATAADGSRLGRSRKTRTPWGDQSLVHGLTRGAEVDVESTWSVSPSRAM